MVCQEDTRRSQLRVQRQIWTGFPFHPVFTRHLLLKGRLGGVRDLVKGGVVISRFGFFDSPEDTKTRRHKVWGLLASLNTNAVNTEPVKARPSSVARGCGTYFDRLSTNGVYNGTSLCLRAFVRANRPISPHPSPSPIAVRPCNRDTPSQTAHKAALANPPNTHSSPPRYPLRLVGGMLRSGPSAATTE